MLVYKAVCTLSVCLYSYILSIDEWMNGDEIWIPKRLISIQIWNNQTLTEWAKD